jgi:hypothetical protein
MIETSYLQTHEVKLNPPLLEVDSIFFHNNIQLSLNYGLEGANIFYKLQDAVDFNSDRQTIDIDQSTSLVYFVGKNGFITSDTSTVQLVKLNDMIEKADLTIDPQPNVKYPGNGNATLSDQVKGSLDFRDGTKWCGFDDNHVTIDVLFEQEITIQKVYVSTLSDVNSWIFSPDKMHLMLDGQPVITYDCPKNSQNETPAYKIFPISFDPTQCTSLRIVIENLSQIPDWHPGKGLSPWLFIDEIVVE